MLRRRLWPLAELRGIAEFTLFVRVMAFAAIVPLLMRVPLRHTAAFVTRRPGGRRSGVVSPERLARLVALASVVAHPIVRTGCLTRGMTLFWFLRRNGVDVELRFGIDPSASTAADADGHCWLTRDGEPYLEKVDPRTRYSEVFRLPLPAA
jgi:hypothetical protein